MLAFRLRLRTWLNEGGVVIYAGVDASPQGGRDWLMVELTIVRRRFLARLYRLIASLLSFNALSLDDRMNQSGAENAVLESIKALIIVLIPPPTVVGAGHANLAMKFMKFCHSLRLLTPDAATLEEVLRSILVCLSDFGTEIGLARISPIPIHQVLLWDESAQPPSMANEEDEEGLFGAVFEDDVDFTRPEDEEVDFSAPSGPPVADLSGSIEVAGI